jgi:Uma2 family endonuclease
MAVLAQTSKIDVRAPDDGATPATPSIHIFTEEDMGESDLQWAIAHLLHELLTDYLAAIGRRVKVGGNLPFLYRPADRKAQVTPDIYVLEDEPAEEQDLGCWKTWERGGKVPSLAVEVVSRASAKDYTLDPEGMLARYQDLGVPEVVRYDPAGHGPRRARRLLSHFTRNEKGVLIEQPLEQPDRVLIRRYGVWLLHVPPRRLRLGLGAASELALWPTQKERIDLAERRAAEAAERAVDEAQRAKTEARRARAEARRAEAEAQRAEAAERELAALRAELEQLRAAKNL